MGYDCKISKETDECTILKAYDDRIMVWFSWIGEGWNGDYDEDDEEDDKLIRFDVLYKNPEDKDMDWEPVEDASYCTQLLVDSPIEYLEKKIKVVFDRYRDVATHIISGGSVKKLGEELSWIS